ncbi:MAG: response regulator transcription factor [Marinilabiliaceae bacterium]|nr:response regulator transcription factor [Marinilabiliaceae bacterium]
MLKSIIIDDEVAAQRSLSKILEIYLPDKIINEGVAGNLREGIALIKKLKPDVVFLDIEMPEQSGLELFDYVEIDFKVVVITAYKEYAIDSLRCGATDYLLKPINIKDLKACIEKISDNFREEKSLILDSSKYQWGKLMVPHQKGFYIVAYSDIEAIEANGNYAWIFKSTGEKLHISRTLGAIETQLPLPYFFRTHRSSIINLNFVSEVNREGGQIKLKNIQQPISDKNIKPLLEKLQEILDVEL